MMYLLLILGVAGNPAMFLYKDLDTCLEQKEIAVKHKKDAHCFRLQEPNSVVEDLRP